MGTNYYHRFNRCDCCGRYDERHICKSMTSFQGYRPDPLWPDEDAPTIVSWADWKAALQTGEVWDEYGRQLNVAQFIDDVEATGPARRRRQYDWMQENGARYRLKLDHDWLDSEGFSFTDREFT
jgi:hypothetical protein